MKLQKILISLLLLLLTLGFINAVPAQADSSTSQQVKAIQKRGVLNVGVKQDVPNFGYLNPDSNTYSGLEIDIAKKIAKELGVKINYVPVTAQTRGQVDMVIATFTITDERKEIYNFTTPYYTDASGFLVNKSSKITDVKDLNNKTIGVVQGSITQTLLEEIAQEKKLNFKYVELGSYPELAVSLRAHRIDAISVDKSILTGYVSSKSNILDYSFKKADYGVVTKKSNTQLNDYVDGLISKWKENGSLQKLYDKYDLKPSTSTDD